MRLRAWLANVFSACGVMLDPSRSSAPSAPLCVGAGLIADGLEFSHTLLEHRVGHISDSVFDSVAEALELGFHLSGALAQFGTP
jgi:hypothetical protein